MPTTNETAVRRYFECWLTQNSAPLPDLMHPNVLYTECYGPQYMGLEQVQRWFCDWHKHGRVLRWDIRATHELDRLLVCEWYFECCCDGKTDGFDGVSLITFAADGRILTVRQFSSKAEHYCPYAQP